MLKKGFTIVELLIVIVVIGILATIIIISYNGITTAATRTSVVTGISQTMKLIKAYIGQNDSYPISVNSSACLGPTPCQWDANTFVHMGALDNNLAKLGQVPAIAVVNASNSSGIIWSYSSTHYVNGISQPAYIIYFMPGTNTPCGVSSGVLNSGGSGAVGLSTTGYTASNSGRTICVITIPGPSV